MPIRDLLAKIENGPENPDILDDAEMADWWATVALDLAAAVTLDTVEVRYTYRDPDDGTTSSGEVTLPAWCSGDPAMAVGLYLFGHRHAVTDVELTAEVLA